MTDREAWPAAVHGGRVGHDRATELMVHLTGYLTSLLYLGVFPEDSRNCPLVYRGATVGSVPGPRGRPLGRPPPARPAPETRARGTR